MEDIEYKKITLPVPPSDNARLTIHAHQHRIILTKVARDYLAQGELIIMAQWPRNTILVPSKSNQLHIKVKAYVPNWRGDCSNFTKILKDVLTNRVYDDDKFVHINYEDTEKDEKNPRVELTIPIRRISLGTLTRQVSEEEDTPDGCTCAYPSLRRLGWPESGITHHPKCKSYEKKRGRT